jgi:hypothetical protein
VHCLLEQDRWVIEISHCPELGDVQFLIIPKKNSVIYEELEVISMLLGHLKSTSSGDEFLMRG